MRGSVYVLAVAIVVVLASAVPAPAQTWVSVRYWPTSVTTRSAVASTDLYNTNMLSVSVRRDLNPDWSISFNGDWGSESNFSATGASALLGISAGNDTLWNFNLHRRWTAGPNVFGLSAGWMSAGVSHTFPAFSASPQTIRVSGPRLGADFMTNRGPWSLTAWAATSVAANVTFTAPGVIAGTETGSGSSYEAGAVVGYRAGGWVLDGGYRVYHMRFNATTTLCACEFIWSGFVVGVTKMFP